MSRLLKIAVREYLAYVKTVGFWLSMLTAPALIALSATAPMLMARSTPPPTVAVLETGFAPAACAHTPCPPAAPGVAGAVSSLLAEQGAVLVSPPPGLAGARDAAAQRAALEPYFAGDRQALALLGASRGRSLDRPLDYAVILTPNTGPDAASVPVSVRVWGRGVVSGSVTPTVQTAVANWTREQRFQALGVPPGQVDAILSARPPVESFSTQAAAGRVSLRDRLPGIAGFAMGIALWAASMTGAGILLNSVIEEKSSRILEVLLTSASVPEIMGGKILGVAAVTTTVLGLWSSISGGILLATYPDVAADLVQVLLSRGLIFYFLFYFLAGYAMYATLFITVGAFCETSREAQTLLGPMMIVLIVPMLFLTQAIAHPDSPLLRVLSWIPTFTPFLMAARAASQPPVWEVLGTGALLLAVIAGEVWLAGRAFRAGALSTSRFDVKYFFASLVGRAAA